MTPLKMLQKAVAVLEDERCKYCLVGGHAASLYRLQERLTSDVDFAILAEPVSGSRKLAERVIKLIGLKPMVGFIPHGPQEKTRKSVCLISTSPKTNQTKGIIDILLPELPWVRKAVERAQFNKIALGFASVPVITAEDLVVAKCYALSNSPERFQDLDDLKEIFLNVKDLDYDYVRSELAHLDLVIPEPVKKFVKFI
jgi:hypothetical protein